MGALKDHIFLFLDVTESEAKDLAQIHGVQGFPTFLVLDAEGELVSTWMGYGEPEPWAAMLGDVLADPVTVVERKARHAEEPGCRDAVALGKMGYTRGDFKKAESYLRQALALDPAAAKDADVPIYLFRATCWGVGTGGFTAEQCRSVTEEVLRAEDVKARDVFEISRTLVRAIDMAGKENVEEVLRMAYPIVADVQDEELQSRLQGFLINYALIVENDTGKALHLKKDSMPPDWESDPGDLNNIAWWCVQQNLNLEQAEGWARRAVEFSETGPDQANIMDTLAEILHARGDTEQAMEWIRKAQELDPDNEYLQYQLDRFQRVLDEDTAVS